MSMSTSSICRRQDKSDHKAREVQTACKVRQARMASMALQVLQAPQARMASMALQVLQALQARTV
jgi:hypothetical protein